MPTWSNVKLAAKVFFRDHPVIAYGVPLAAILALSYNGISHYANERKVERIAGQVGVLESMIESGNADGTKSLASSLYEELHDEADPRLRNLYDDIVFPCYQSLKESGPSLNHRVLHAK